MRKLGIYKKYKNIRGLNIRIHIHRYIRILLGSAVINTYGNKTISVGFLLLNLFTIVTSNLGIFKLLMMYMYIFGNYLYGRLTYFYYIGNIIHAMLM